jgi:tetratricopeptide (TPR) repeat protein
MKWGAVALLAWSSLARAAGPSPLWEDVAHPDRPKCDALVAKVRAKVPAGLPDPRSPPVVEVTALAAEAARRCPEHAAAQALFGHIKLELNKDYQGALVPLERARTLEDGDPRLSPDKQLAFELGLARAVSGDLEGSLDEYRRAEAAGGAHPVLLYDMGDSYQALGRLHEAIDAYRRAIKLAPREAIHHWALAVALDRDGQLAASRLEIDAALAADPRIVDQLSDRYFFVPPADHWYYLALTYRAQGKLDLARQAVANFLHDLPDGMYAARARELQATLQR